MSKVPPYLAVIDDEKRVRKALGRLLVSAGFAVRTFSGGKLLLDSLATRLPGCTVCAWLQPAPPSLEAQAKTVNDRVLLEVISSAIVSAVGHPHLYPGN